MSSPRGFVTTVQALGSDPSKAQSSSGNKEQEISGTADLESPQSPTQEEATRTDQHEISVSVTDIPELHTLIDFVKGTGSNQTHLRFFLLQKDGK